ncbi:MAG: class I SAM-dependent methyltransferase [Ramlibacter sp.]|nr:class I SAM-dependent methyltransferase [Ramlibacter sp.]
MYQREIQLEAEAEDSLTKLVQKVSAGAEVLDVGTGSGALGQHLSKALNCTVDGLTYNEDEQRTAGPYYRSILLVDLEQEPLPETIRQRRYDFVVCADVLEHLRNAPAVLSELRSLLKPGGIILLSIPNVTHIGVLLGLLAGRFGRTHEGLLDETHVHFYDRESLRQLCVTSGLTIVQTDAVRRNLIDTEFARLDYQSVPVGVRQYLLGLPDAEVYQFVWSLRPSSPDESSAAVAAPAPSLSPAKIEPQFSIQLYLDEGDGFKEKESLFAFGFQRPELQDIRLKLQSKANVQRIRLDFGDRPGSFEFAGVQAFDARGQEIWGWQGDWFPGLSLNDCFLTGQEGRHGGRIVRCTGNDPWVCFQVDPQVWAQAEDIVVRLSSPTAMADALFMRVDSMLAQLEQSHNDLSSRLDARMEVLNGHVDSLQQQLRDATESNRRLQGELTLVRAQFSEVMNSSSWRWTAGLRAMARWLGKLRA